MKKKQIRVFGHTYYLLGKSKDGDLYYMQEPEWQCNWYWGGLYLTVFTNKHYPERSKDISLHTHFDILFFKGPINCYDMFTNFFEETVLAKDETWKLLELMKSFYILTEAASLLTLGGAHICTSPLQEILNRPDMKEIINKELIPAITKEVLNLLKSDI